MRISRRTSALTVTAWDPIVDRVACSRLSVLIIGESGAGKEVLARRLHERSPRAAGPLVAVNAAAVCESLLESELFGYERGAFTGAVNAKAGLIESADGGTLFLDEVAEMSLSAQAKLLRVLETKIVTRVGSVRARRIDVRFVAATNQDLDRRDRGRKVPRGPVVPAERNRAVRRAAARPQGRDPARRTSVPEGAGAA